MGRFDVGRGSRWDEVHIGLCGVVVEGIDWEAGQVCATIIGYI